MSVALRISSGKLRIELLRQATPVLRIPTLDTLPNGNPLRVSSKSWSSAAGRSTSTSESKKAPYRNIHQ